MALYKRKGNDSIVELEPLRKRETVESSGSSKNTVVSNSNQQGDMKSTPGGEGGAMNRPNALFAKMSEVDKAFAVKLLNAVISRDSIAVRMLLLKRGDVNLAIGGDGLTGLHFAAAVGDPRVVEALLDFKADPHAEDRNGRTPFFIAAAKANAPCLTAMIKAGANPNTRVNLKPPGDSFPSTKTDAFLAKLAAKIEIPTPAWDGSTALHEASRANCPECVNILLEAGAKADAFDKNCVTPLLLAGAGLEADQKEAILKYERVVKLLVEKKANGNANNEGMAISALLNAVFLGSLTALKLLMDAKADPSWSSENGGGITALHEAAGRGRVDMLTALICHTMDIRRKRTLANAQDAVKRTPLHKAAYAGSKDCICLLLECGADLSLKTSTGVSGIEAIMLYVPDSKAFLCLILDSCITCNIPRPEDPYFAVWLNFSLLAPEVRQRQTDVLNALFITNTIPKDYKRVFLLHPLVETFVRFKWFELRKYFILVVIVYALFVLNLSIYVTLAYITNDNANNKKWFYMYLMISRYSTLLFAALVLVTVIGQCYIHFHYYLRQLETWTNGLSSIFSIIWMIIEEPLIKNELQSQPFLVHHFVSISVPVAWAGLMLLLGRFPTWGARALLFGVVLKNVIWTLLVLGCIILGFSFSFFVQFHSVNPDAFGDPWKSFFNTIVMMTGEYEYLDIFKSGKSFLPGTSRVLFFIFITMASIVLVNLIVGLAVTDTQSMQAESEVRSLYKRAEFVDLLERTLASIARYSALNKTVKIKVHGQRLDKSSVNISILTNEVIDSLTKVALNQRRIRQNNRKTSPGELSLYPLITMEGSLHIKISKIVEQFVGEIIQAVQEDKEVNVETNRSSGTRGNIASYSSTHLQTVLHKVITTQRSTYST